MARVMTGVQLPVARAGAEPAGRAGHLHASSRRWWYPSTPLARLARLRAVLYLFVPLDVVWFTPWVGRHAAVPSVWYQPLAIGRTLHLPTPTSALIHVLQVSLLIVPLIAATGRAPRLWGWLTFALYGEWMVIAMSYGKVDHDRFALLVALAVLPTAGRARWRDTGTSEAAGWAVRCIQVSVVCVYFLSALAKFRYGGFGWVNGSTLSWAVLRRGTVLARPLLHVPWLLHITQWGIVLMELGSPLLLFLPRRGQASYVIFLALFHVVVFASITILFGPHLICLLAFAPLEKAPAAVRRLTGHRLSR